MKRTLLLLALLVVPGTAFAAKFNNITDLINFFVDIIYNSIVPLLITLAVVVFFWGLVVFIRKSDNATEHEKGRSMMLWGVIAIFVMVSVWGLVGVLAGTFGINVCLPGAPGTGCNRTSGTNSTEYLDFR